ncbi:MAG: hypothetical protein WDN26_02635 [Chitinophagaceae bacterium]
MTLPVIPHPSSYRDPSGFIFEKEGMLYRQVNISFKEHFDYFIQSGCYKSLTEKGLVISHEVINDNLTGRNNSYTTLKPEKIPFISYSSEWSFDMLKDAALLTLRLVKEALQFNMVLKDATPYNIQWHKGKLIFIDTLSFEKYEETPWIAYRQFCETFLGPLLIMHYSKQHLQQLQLAWPDGIPLDIVRSLLPKRSRWSLHVYLHIHLHNKVSAKNKEQKNVSPKFSKEKLLRLISSLEILVNKLKLPAIKSTWSEYYEEVSQRKDYLEQKKKIIAGWVAELKDIHTAADLGANEGEFSKILAEKNIEVVVADFDPNCINKLYSDIKINNGKNILPLIINLANPTPATGVNNKERISFLNRLNVDLVLALALIHHLAIGKNIPFEKIAELFSKAGKYLIIEFAPKEDEKVKEMLGQKKDIYDDYTEENFKSGFSSYFTIEKRQGVPGSKRIIYLLKSI